MNGNDRGRSKFVLVGLGIHQTLGCVGDAGQFIHSNDEAAGQMVAVGLDEVEQDSFPTDGGDLYGSDAGDSRVGFQSRVLKAEDFCEVVHARPSSFGSGGRRSCFRGGSSTPPSRPLQRPSRDAPSYGLRCCSGWYGG